MKILKFGGTSLANAKLFLHVAKIIEKNTLKEQIAVVLSAPAKITNYLADIIQKISSINLTLDKINITESIFLTLIKDITKIQSCFPYKKTKIIIIEEFNKIRKIIQKITFLKKCPENFQAVIISRGEILSVVIMENLLQSRNHQVIVIDPIKNIKAIGSYLDSTVDIYQSKKNINNININNYDVILMSGFIGGNEKKELVVLGRNGSDYSAAILSVCLNAQSCEIWTDVDGVFTADPKEVFSSYLLKSISYLEAMELSHFGAKVLHPRTIEPLAKFQIPCWIKNTTNANAVGTLISTQNILEKKYLKGITYLNNIVMITISGENIQNEQKIISNILTYTSQKNIKIILVTQSSSENNISICIFEKNINEILFALKQNFNSDFEKTILKSLNITKNISILSVVGSNISKKHNITSKIFSTLSALKINVLAIAYGSSKNSISIAIDQDNISKAVQNIHDVLFFKQKILHIFLIGIGGVGKALLNQIKKQKPLLHQKNIDIRCHLIANSKKSLLKNAINLTTWEKSFEKSQSIFNLETLNKLLKNYSYLNSVIIDCTSDKTLSQQYINFLSKGFNVVTSNKKANTGSLEYYNKIRTTTLKENKKFLYETNVGAGLPVIQTLKNLLITGDNLISFKGILSGSLSFIFGKLEEGTVLSEATRQAKMLGFTEPNPYDDLSGIDVARKLLVLAREVGYAIELKDINIESILPEYFKKYNHPEEFLSHLSELDSSFLNRIQKARDTGCVLRLVGNIDKKGKCSVKIEEINKNHPLYKIKNGENALTFYTNYYQPIPLVLRGYGAGNNVTASGVFSDLLRTIL